MLPSYSPPLKGAGWGRGAAVACTITGPAPIVKWPRAVV